MFKKKALNIEVNNNYSITQVYSTTAPAQIQNFLQFSIFWNQNKDD